MTKARNSPDATRSISLQRIRPTTCFDNCRTYSKRGFLAPHLLGREYVQARDIRGRSDFPFPLGLKHILERFGSLVFGRSPRIVGDAGQSRINSQARAPAFDHLVGDPAWQQFRPIDLVEQFAFYQRSEVAVRADIDIRRGGLTGGIFGRDLAAHLRHRGSGSKADFDVRAKHLVHHRLELRSAFGAAQSSLAPHELELAFLVCVLNHRRKGRRPLRGENWVGDRQERYNQQTDQPAKIHNASGKTIVVYI